MSTPTAPPLISASLQVGEATRRYLPYGRTSAAVQVHWSAAPARYKRYPTTQRIVLPWPPNQPRHQQNPEAQPGDWTVQRLSTLLCDLSGLTRLVWTHPIDPMTGRGTGGPPGQTVLRPAPSGGALYPVEVYLATGAAPGLPTGLYHYDPAHHALHRLRDGDHRPALTGLLATPPAARPDLILALAPVWWRNAFKYREFGYRLMCQETGVLTAQALALSEPLGLTATVHLHYADQPVNDLLGLDTFRESVTALLTVHQTVGQAGDRVTPSSPGPSYTDLLARSTATAADPPPTITHLLPVAAALHAASLSPGQYPHPDATNHDGPPTISLTGGAGPPVPLPAADVHLAAGIPHRASAPAGFHHRPLSRDMLAMVLAAADHRHPEDLRGTVHLYCLISRVEGLPPGGYRCDTDSQTLLPIAGAEAIGAVAAGIRAPMTWLALREAAVALIPVGDPETEVARYGDRGYRLLQIATGLTVHRTALAAAALGLSTRLHSDGTTDTTDTALGLTGTPWSSQTMLLIGALRPALSTIQSCPTDGRIMHSPPLLPAWREIRRTSPRSG